MQVHLEPVLFFRYGRLLSSSFYHPCEFAQAVYTRRLMSEIVIRLRVLKLSGGVCVEIDVVVMSFR